MLSLRQKLPGLRACLLFFVVFLAVVQVAAIVLGMCGVHLTQLLALLVLAVAAALGLLAGRGLAREPVSGPARTPVPVFLPQAGRWLLAVCLVLFGGFALLAYRVPDCSYDGNSYHIPALNQWAIRGYIHDVDPQLDNSEFMNGYPKGAEAVTFVVVRALGTGFTNFPNLLYAPLGLFGIALLCSLFGATAGESLLFGAAYLLVPANAIQYDSTYVDAAFGAATIALIALLGAHLAGGGKKRLAGAVVIGCAAGNVLGVKGSGVFITVICLASFAAWAWIGVPGLHRRARSLLVPGCACLLVAAAVGGFWYAKNYVRHGSPIYPIGLSVAGHRVWPGISTLEALNETQNTPVRLQSSGALRKLAVSWLTPLKTKPWSYGGTAGPLVETDTRVGALGIFWGLGALPAIPICVWWLRRRGAHAGPGRPLYAFLATAVFLAFLTTPMNWWARYTVWLFALGMPSVWLVLRGAREARPGVRRCVRMWAGACFALLALRAAIILLVACIRPFADVQPARHHIPTLAYHRETPLMPLFPEMRSPLVAGILQSDSAVGVGPRDLGLYAAPVYGQLARPVGRRNLVAVSAGATEADVAGLRARQGVHFVLWLSACPVPAALAAHARLRGVDGPFTLLELTEE